MSVKHSLLAICSCWLLACGGGGGSPPSEPVGTEEARPDPQRPLAAPQEPAPDPQSPQLGGEEPLPNAQDPLPSGSPQPSAGGAAPAAP